MTTQAALLRAIAHEPDDDAPRLVLADWLEEHGQDERAELLRAQVALARDRRDSPKRRKLAFRARQLLDAHEAEWVGAWQELLHEHTFARGLLDRVGLRAADFPALAGELFTTVPLRRLWLTGLKDDLSPLDVVPPGNHLTGLDLNGNFLTTKALRKLARHPYLGELRTLSLLFNRIDDKGADLLIECPFFQPLSLIRCGANPITPAARERLKAHFGDRVTFALEREDDHLYAFQNDYAFTTGCGKGHTQVFAMSSLEQVDIALFDHEGNLLQTEHIAIAQVVAESQQERSSNRMAAVAQCLQDRRFKPGVIRVKRFRFTADEGIDDFNWWHQPFDQGDQARIREMRSSVEGWLITGQFQWDFGDDNCWLDRSGEVTDT